MKPLASVATSLRHNPLVRLYKNYVIDSILIIKRHGFKELIRRRGWKIVWIVGGYYLVRDTLVYIVLPYCIARGVF